MSYAAQRHGSAPASPTPGQYDKLFSTWATGTSYDNAEMPQNHGIMVATKLKATITVGLDNEVIDKEGANVDSKSTKNCNVLQVVELLVVKLRVVNKGRDVEGVVVCLTLGNNRSGPVCREFKNM